MNKKSWMIGAGLLLAAGIAVLVNVRASHAQADADKASLVAQRAAGGGRGPGGPGGPGGFAQMTKELNLSEAQQQQMDKARQEMEAQMSKLRSAGANDSDTRAKMQALMQSQRAAMDSILTSDQKAKLQALMAKGGPMGGPPGGGMAGGGIPGGGPGMPPPDGFGGPGGMGGPGMGGPPPGMLAGNSNGNGGGNR